MSILYVFENNTPKAIKKKFIDGIKYPNENIISEDDFNALLEN